MRVVAGVARGRRLVTPPGLKTRPTSDRVRGAVFNSLGSMQAIEHARVLDLFAGSGALGIEALSRGAAHATFVETNPEALRCIRANLDSTGFGEAATVLRSTAEAFLDSCDQRFDLALVDPPYAFDDWRTLLERLSADVAVLESDRRLDLAPNWQSVREKRYGSTVVTIARSSSDDGHHEERA